MNKETLKKLKQVGFFSAVVLGTIFAVNTVANRVSAVAKLRDTVQRGI